MLMRFSGRRFVVFLSFAIERQFQIETTIRVAVSFGSEGNSASDFEEGPIFLRIKVLFDHADMRPLYAEAIRAVRWVWKLFTLSVILGVMNSKPGLTLFFNAISRLPPPKPNPVRTLQPCELPSLRRSFPYEDHLPARLP